jgi:hypothetical protein
MKYDMNFQDVSKRIYPKLKQHRREAMGPKLTAFQIWQNKYNHSPEYRVRFDFTCGIAVSFIIAITFVTLALYYSSQYSDQ